MNFGPYPPYFGPYNPYPAPPPVYPPSQAEDPMIQFDRNISYWEQMKKRWKEESKGGDADKKRLTVRGLVSSDVFWIMLVFAPIIGPGMAWFYLRSWQIIIQMAAMPIGK